MTHNALVQKAVTHLAYSLRCNPVFGERNCQRTSETPDAIGWQGGVCHLIECKASLADFRADANKIFRKMPEQGMGNYRYYMMPTTVWEQTSCGAAEIPANWGLLLVDERGQIERRRFTPKAERQVSNIVAERDYLRSRVLAIQSYGKTMSATHIPEATTLKPQEPL
jgi:hypothetical protein